MHTVCAGKNLQAQYERWQPRAKYKTHLDPTVDDVKKLAISCRKSARVWRRALLISRTHCCVYVSTPVSTCRYRCPRVDTMQPPILH